MLFTLTKLWSNWQQRKQALAAAKKAEAAAPEASHEKPAQEKSAEEKSPKNKPSRPAT